MPFGADEFTGKRFGKYEVLCRIAVGGMAEIFLGFPLAGPFAFKPVVLKRILSDHREDPSSLQMLIDEAKLTAQLSHPHVAQVLDLEVAGEDVLLVIELIQGANVEELVNAFDQRKEPLPLGLVISTIRDAAQGLQHAHTYKDAKGNPLPIIHRDVTPRNLMVTFDGVAKVLDFGIARAAGASRRTIAGMVRGTAAYMSPEQAIDAKVDTRSDIFSLGTIFHELLTGQRLFARGNPAKEMAAVYEAEIPIPSIANKRVPKALDAVVLRALERSVSRRYQTPAELIRDLNAAAATVAWTPERCGPVIRERFEQRKHDLEALLERIPDDPASSASTDVSRKGLESGEVPGARTVIAPMPSSPTGEMNLDDTPAAPRATSSTAVSKAAVPTQAAGRKAVKAPDDDASVPTRFFTPEFGAPPKASKLENITDEGPIPTAVSVPSPTIVTQPSQEIPSSPGVSAPLSARRHLAHDTATQPSQKPRGRTLGLVLGALAAMILGALGGVLVYRSVSGGPVKPQTMVGLGRLSIATDRPAEVKVGDEVLKAPFDDVYLPPGHRALAVRENSGLPWKTLEVDVAPDKPTRLEVKLDALAPVP